MRLSKNFVAAGLVFSLLAGLLLLTSYYSRNSTILLRPTQIILSLAPTLETNNIDNLSTEERHKNTSRCIQRRSREFKGDFAPGSLIIIFNDNISTDDGIKQIKGYELEVMHEYRASLSGVSIRVPPGTEVEWACKLEQDTNIDHVEFNQNTSLGDPIEPQ